MTLELPPLKLWPVATSPRWASSIGAVGWRAKDGISWAMALVSPPAVLLWLVLFWLVGLVVGRVVSLAFCARVFLVSLSGSVLCLVVLLLLLLLLLLGGWV